MPGGRALDVQQPDRGASEPAPEPGTAGPGTAGPGTEGSGDAGAPRDHGRRGLRGQLGATIAAGRRLVQAHVELALAELSEILDEVKRVAALVGAAIGALILLAFFLPIGLFLFIGETLFGSIGWGVLHGTLLLVGFAMAMLLHAIEFRGRALATDLGIAILLGIVVGVVLALELTNRAWTALGDQVAPGVSADIRPLVVGTVTVAIIGAVIGLIVGARSGGMGGAIVGIIVGAIIGALIGAVTAATLGVRVGAAIGVTVVLLGWPILMALRVQRQGVDTEALRARFVRTQTIDMTKETIEWVRERTPLGPAS